MIAIVNMGPRDDPDPLGVRIYEVRLCNERTYEVMATFEHKRSDGLGLCLLKASQAVERRKWESVAQVVARLQVIETKELNEPRKIRHRAGRRIHRAVDQHPGGGNTGKMHKVPAGVPSDGNYPG